MAEILFDCKDKPEADDLVTEFLEDLTVSEQKEFLAFIQGFRLAKGLGKGMRNRCCDVDGM